MLKRTKLFSETVRSLDEKNRTAEYIISTDHVDRMGEVVEQKWQLENYKANPVVLFGHDPSKADNVLGKCIELNTEKDDDGHAYTKAKVKFADEGTSATADTVFKLVKQGILKTVSVGFIPHTFKHTTDKDNGDEEITVLSDNELLEFSIVPIPANPNAVALAYEDGSITEDDAKYMLKAYATEGEYIGKSLCDIMKKTQPAQNKENKGMSDEDINKLAEALGTVIDEKVGAKLDEIMSKLDDGEDSDEEAPADGGNELSNDDEDEDKKPADESDDEDEDEDEDKKSDDEDEDEDEDEEEEKALLKAIEDMSSEEAQDLVKELGL